MEEGEDFPMTTSNHTQGREDEEKNERENADEESSRSIKMRIGISDKTVLEVGEEMIGMLLGNTRKCTK